MAKNFISTGKQLTLSVPAAGVTTGLGVLIGSLFCVALNTVAFASGATFNGSVSGIWFLLKTSAQAWADGDKIYWDNLLAVCTNAPTAGARFIGYAVGAAANPSASGNVRLCSTALLEDDSSPAPVSDATVGPRTYTAAEILSRTIVRDTNGASRSDVLPTAALLVAALPGVRVGDTIDCLIVNGADAAEVLTIGAGSGGAFDANQTAASRVIGQNGSKTLRIRFTNVTAASEAYVAYL